MAMQSTKFTGLVPCAKNDLRTQKLHCHAQRLMWFLKMCFTLGHVAALCTVIRSMNLVWQGTHLLRAFMTENAIMKWWTIMDSATSPAMRPYWGGICKVIVKHLFCLFWLEPFNLQRAQYRVESIHDSKLFAYICMSVPQFLLFARVRRHVARDNEP
jgi:hypothetical protein